MAAFSAASWLPQNINGIKWRNWNNGTLTRKGYNFSYDGLNRLTMGDFGTFSGSWANTNNYDLSGVTYDRNGNIATMNCKNASGGDKENLSYSYNGNQLNSVTGTYNGVTGKTGTFTYDANGNSISDGLRGLSTVTYFDEVDLPKQYVKDASNKVDYQYDASGKKWGKTATINGSATSMSYRDEFIYQGSTLKMVLTPEGYYDPQLGNYFYYLKDHLGNTRITFHYSGTTAIVDQEAEYYPFGALFAQNNLDKNVYLYNGKELNNEFFENYDYGARFYDPSIGRFHSVDPHAENYYSWSPYHYVANNPMAFTDPTGKDWYQDEKGNTMWQKGSADVGGYKNIGTTYTQNIGDGVSIGYTQNEATSMTTNTMTSDQWVSQYDSRFGDKEQQDKACNKASDAMLANDGNSSSGMTVIVNNDGNGRAGTANGNATNAISDMSKALDFDKPTKVNVDFRSGTESGDKMGDHFVVIQGKTEQISNGKVTSTNFNFFDPGTSQPSKGTSSSNILRIENNRLVGTHINNGRPIVVSSIRPTR